MLSSFRFFLINAITILIIAGCSGHNSQPTAPDATTIPPALIGNADVSDDSGGNTHYLLSSGLIYINTENPDDPIVEIIPAREGEIHFNVLKFLEGAPCFDCFRIMGFDFPGPGYKYLDLDVRIDHPFDDLLFSVFDLRCIIMFDGSHQFPSTGKTTSDPSIGEGALLNAEGYTALYNGSTLSAPVGDYQKYFPGKLSTELIPNADINGYIYFRSDDPTNNRNAFYAGSIDVKTLSMQLPSSTFVIGYAVDASWAPPIETPVDDPLTDFGTDANCLEPWKIVVTEEPIGLGLTDHCGQTKLLIDVYDWQGKETHHDPEVECPEIFDGTLTATWVSDGAGYSEYEATISNSLTAPIGEYMCLIRIEANENDPVNKPWLDLTAYQMQKLTIIEQPHLDPVAVAEANPNPQSINFPVSFSGSGSYDPDCGDIQVYEWDWDNDGIYDETGENVEHTWTSPGIYLVQLRVTDDESQTDTLDEPLEINISQAGSGDLIWAKRAGGASSDPDSWNDAGCGITTLSDNSTVVTGYFYDQATFGPGETNETVLTTTGDGDLDIFVARYNPDGTLAWAKRAGGPFDRDRGSGITTLSDNSTVVTGTFYKSATFAPGEPNETVLTSTGGFDIFIARYNPDGSLVWVKRAGGTGTAEANGITTLSDNSTVATGLFSATATFGPGEPNETILTAAGCWDIFIARYNPDGTLAWAKRAGGTVDINFPDMGNGITALSDNSTVVTGLFGGSATFGPEEPNETVLTSAGWSDIFVARYNPDGTLAWSKRA
ncbi:MAG: PKD domain-containing protein, partial [bacterium]|nr:PKD domain-containing protein [bacterium]